MAGATGLEPIQMTGMVTKSDLLQLEEMVNKKVMSAMDQTTDLIKRTNQSLVLKVGQIERSFS